MVFRQLSEVKKESRIPPLESQTETETEGSSLMSTVPVKSQPLHNFSLPHLKWGKNQTSHQRCRKPSDSSRSSQNHHQNRSSTSEAESDGGSSSHHHQDQDMGNQKSSVGSRALVNQKNRFLNSSSGGGGDSITVDVKTETKSDDGKSTNLLLRISKNKSGTGNGGSGGGEVEGEMEETMMNHWNLRPRRSIHGKTNNNDHGKGGASKNGGHHDFEEVSIQPKSLRLRGLVETENVEKKEKIKFSIPLARDEIEEDFFAWTGSKPPRRPKKRNRTIQKQLDNAFPGLWLAGITADCYNVPELTSKHK